ncbi:MAG: magnesium transporter [Gemmatimonadota bacterium]|nr:MAG: magnesium transporter [Gemmatimonadota bacterium]
MEGHMQLADNPGLQEELQRLAEEGKLARFLARARHLHPSDLSDVLASLEEDLRLRLVQALPPEVVSEALAEMEEEEHPEEVLAALRPEQAADIVEELDVDDAADLISELPARQAERVLAYVAVRDDIERLLRYDEESAGGLMNPEAVVVRETATAAQAIDEIRRQAEEVEDFYQIYCVDDGDRLVGILPIQRVVVAKPETPVQTIMEPPLATVTPDVDQEEVAQLMARYNIPAIAVVSLDGGLLGRVTFDDVMDVVEAEATEDILKFGGAPGEEQLAGEWHQAVRSRLPWLYLNMITASLAAAVVFLFQDTIDRMWVLAAVMPIIAAMGGNAGTQALAVTVRRIAVGMIPPGKGFRVVGKELLVGAVNGVAVGLLAGLVTAPFGWGWEFGAVVTCAMWGTLVLATTAGALIPLVLQKLGVDPAVASSVFVTALTDVVGFFLLLGLAAAFLLPRI